jgi:Arc/MetJ-type ribon-helix-helix transcriptional regulator
MMVKVKLTVSISPELVRWIDEQVKLGHFADRSHAVQYSVIKVKELIEKGNIKF